MAFELTVAGEVFRSDDLTIDEAVAIEKATGTSWLYLNPLRSGETFRAMAVAFLRRTKTPAEAEAIVGKLGLRDAIAAVKVVEEDLPDEYEDGLPKAEGDPSTPTS